MSATSDTVARILDLIRDEALGVGEHMAAQRLADRLRVSRFPVTEALGILEQAGVVQRQRHRGYFLLQDREAIAANPAAQSHRAGDDIVTRSYFRLAEELLRGELPSQCSEAQLRQRYALTGAQVQALLSRIAGEGWASRKPGYGWEFSTMLTTPDALLQSYRLRLAVEPAALREPGYAIRHEVIERCRAVELHLLDGGIETDSADQLHARGLGFHESLVEASGNPFFIETVKRVNRVRRLLSYRSMQDRTRYREHCEQHLRILDLLEQQRNAEAAEALAGHLRSTLRNLGLISALLRGPGSTPDHDH
jgi:DNA-binding GntR family transcriptional regulator